MTQINGPHLLWKLAQWRNRSIAVVLGVAIALLSGKAAQAQQVFLNGLPRVQGIATDSSGNVYVNFDGTFTTYTASFTPAGAFIRANQLGGIIVGDAGRFARIPNTDGILYLTSRGRLYLYGRDLQFIPIDDLSRFSLGVANSVFDVTTRRFRPMSLGIPNWGDIAVSRPNANLIRVYVTATTGAAGGFPFVMRLDFNGQMRLLSSRVMATSTATTVGMVNQPRGIAVNSLGWVLTTFPVRFPNFDFRDTLVAFRENFPEAPNANTLPRFVLRDLRTVNGLWDMASRGMTTDAANNFYIATGSIGSSLCRSAGSSSALVLINPNPNVPNARCVNLPAVIANGIDVTVSPVGNIPYMTVGNSVIRFNRLR